MSTDSVSENLRIKKSDALWLIMAVLVHASLLLIPLQPAPVPDNRPRTVSVTLQSPAPAELVEDQTASQLPQEVTSPTTELPLAEVAPLPPESPPDAVDDPSASEIDTPPLITVARLIDEAQHFKWALPESEKARQLGIFRPRATPDNWRPKIAREDNIFNGMTLPEKTEVLDRWLAADGSQHVVIETTTGHTLCGMQRMWNPMNPLLEQVMMFRPCGGGGKRKIKLPKRYQSKREFLEGEKSSVLR